LAGTRRSDPGDPGIARIRCGKGFTYRDARGERVADDEVGRIKALAIPPAWTEVWICPDPLGHIQAVGTDAAGRRQYLYHDAWRARRDREKFARLPDFAAALPVARKALITDLGRPGLVRERVLACAVRLLDIGLFRIGGEDYAEENDSYGLATLQRRHVRVRKGRIVFEYVAKGGAERSQVVEDDVVLPTVLALKRRRAAAGEQLLAYRAERGGWVSVDAAAINRRIKELLGETASAKDFRTWNATVLAAVGLARGAGAPEREVVRATVDRVAAILGNTPAVARDSYIDPRVIAAYERGRTIRSALARIERKTSSDRFAEREAIERAVIRMLG
jgi:DNA topoisomerase IB